MAEVLKNLELRGCTMGSLKEFKQMVQFVDKHQIQPVVHKSLCGFEAVEEGFQIMKAGKQFGKIVVVIDPENQHKL
jgi:D-arabinose 1-dehydrogenase-like Zn-dependent alcohol dehydrogenase